MRFFKQMHQQVGRSYVETKVGKSAKENVDVILQSGQNHTIEQREWKKDGEKWCDDWALDTIEIISEYSQMIKMDKMANRMAMNESGLQFKYSIV